MHYIFLYLLAYSDHQNQLLGLVYDNFIIRQIANDLEQLERIISDFSELIWHVFICYVGKINLVFELMGKIDAECVFFVLESALVGAYLS